MKLNRKTYTRTCELELKFYFAIVCHLWSVQYTCTYDQTNNQGILHCSFNSIYHAIKCRRNNDANFMRETGSAMRLGSVFKFIIIITIWLNENKIYNLIRCRWDKRKGIRDASVEKRHFLLFSFLNSQGRTLNFSLQHTRALAHTHNPLVLTAKVFQCNFMESLPLRKIRNPLGHI